MPCTRIMCEDSHEEFLAVFANALGLSDPALIQTHYEAWLAAEAMTDIERIDIESGGYITGLESGAYYKKHQQTTRPLMKRFKQILIGLAIGTMASVASGQTYTHHRIGNFDFYNGDNGYQGFGQHIGPYYFYNDDYGTGFGHRIGNTDYFHYTPNNVRSHRFWD